MNENPLGIESPCVETRARFLGETHLFGHLDAGARGELADLAEFVTLAGGERLLRRGDPGDALYLILEGRLRVQVDAEDGEGLPRVICELSRGDVVGEMALVSDEPRIADVMAARDTNLLRLTRDDFQHFAARYPETFIRMTRLIIQRLGATVEGPESSARIVNLLWLPTRTAPLLRAAARQLSEALAGLCSTLHLDCDRFDREFGEGSHRMAWTDPRSADAVRFLHAQERRYRFVLYEGDRLDSPWSERGIRQADRILVVASADAEPDGHDFRERFCPLRSSFRHQRLELLLVHGPDTELPERTQRWLDALPGIVRHHHVRLGHSADFARVARCLTHSAVGVVLGGGGARGLAHAGVLQAMEELGIPADNVGGTSMGAIFAAGSAIGWSAGEMLDRVREVFRPKRALFDVTFPMVSLLAGGKLGRVLDSLFGKRRIEDLWSNYFCVSTNLTEASLVVHRTGLLRDAIRASISLPGVFPPVLTAEGLLVDGGVLNNLPIDVMAEQCEGGPVVAVDVSGTDPSLFDLNYRDVHSGWSTLRRRLVPFCRRPRVPTIFDVLMRSTVVGSRKTVQGHVDRGQADLILAPPVQGIGTLEFGRYEELAKIGLEYARAAFSEWERPSLVCEINS